MKKIEIKKIGLPDKKSVYVKYQLYAVYIGNGHTERFSNLKEAKAFLANVNRYYNFKLSQLNELLSSVYVSYRNYWSIFYDKKTGSNKLQAEHKIVDYLKAAEHAIDMSWRVCDSENGPYNVVHHFTGALSSLELTVDLLKKVTRDRNLMNDYNRLEALRQNILWVSRSIANYKGIAFEEIAEKEIDLPLLKIVK